MEFMIWRDKSLNRKLLIICSLRRMFAVYSNLGYQWANRYSIWTNARYENIIGMIWLFEGYDFICILSRKSNKSLEDYAETSLSWWIPNLWFFVIHTVWIICKVVNFGIGIFFMGCSKKRNRSITDQFCRNQYFSNISFTGYISNWILLLLLFTK